MKKLLFLALCFSLRAMAGTPFQFHPSETGSDGPTAAYATFKNGDHEARYVPPLKWSVSGDRIRPEGKEMADARIEMFSIPLALPWDKDHVKQVQDWVLARFVPKDSTNVVGVSAAAGPMKICGLEPYGIVVSYALFGMSYQSSITIVERDKIRFCFIITTQKKDFQDLYGTFLGSLFSVDGI